MANEAVQVEGPYESHDFTVSTGTTIEKGALMQFTDPRTAIISSTKIAPIAGIAGTEKKDTDNAAELGLWTTGTFSMIASQAITAGQFVMPASDIGTYPNHIDPATSASTSSGSQVFGYALEDIGANTTGEVKLRL